MSRMWWTGDWTRLGYRKQVLRRKGKKLPQIDAIQGGKSRRSRGRDRLANICSRGGIAGLGNRRRKGGQTKESGAASSENCSQKSKDLEGKRRTKPRPNNLPLNSSVRGTNKIVSFPYETNYICFLFYIYFNTIISILILFNGANMQFKSLALMKSEDREVWSFTQFHTNLPYLVSVTNFRNKQRV